MGETAQLDRITSEIGLKRINPKRFFCAKRLSASQKKTLPKSTMVAFGGKKTDGKESLPQASLGKPKAFKCWKDTFKFPSFPTPSMKQHGLWPFLQKKKGQREKHSLTNLREKTERRGKRKPLYGNHKELTFPNNG